MRKEWMSPGKSAALTQEKRGTELQESQPDAAFDDLLYYRSGNGEDRLALMKEGNAFASISLPGDIYEEVKKRYQPLIDQYGDETIIDMEWVMNSVAKAEGH